MVWRGCVCWFEPLLEGNPAPLYTSPMSSVCLCLLPICCPCLPSLPWLIFTGTGHTPPAFSKEGQLLGRDLPALYAPQTANVAAVAPLRRERLNHGALDAVERAVHHVEGLTIDSKARPQHHCPAFAAGKQHHDPFLPPHLVAHVLVS